MVRNFRMKYWTAIKDQQSGGKHEQQMIVWYLGNSGNYIRIFTRIVLLISTENIYITILVDVNLKKETLEIRALQRMTNMISRMWIWSYLCSFTIVFKFTTKCRSVKSFENIRNSFWWVSKHRLQRNS